MIPTSSPRELSSRCGVITPTAIEESETSINGSGCEMVAYSDDETQEEDEEGEEEEEEELMKPAPATCDLCSQAPCDWELFGEQIWEECNSMKEEGSDNKGILCRYDHRPLPVCVRCEIMDSWPDPDHVYVRFQSAVRDVVDH
jgi:hypothetical protein